MHDLCRSGPARERGPPLSGKRRPSPNARVHTALPIPTSFRGRVLEGDDAARRASRVSGPFTASPRAFVTPRDGDDLARLLAWAWEEGVPLIPRAAGTGMPGGNLGDHLVVELTEGFLEPPMRDPATGWIRAGAGVIAADAERVARHAGGTLPFLPSSAQWCTLGGVVANNGAGARSFRHGSAAARLRAVEGFLPWGEPFRLRRGELSEDPFRSLLSGLRERFGATPPDWPRLRKNSSGYAIDRLLASGEPLELIAGSEGTLVILTAVEFDPVPAPEGVALTILPARTPAELGWMALEADRLGTTTCEFLGRRFLEMAGLAHDPLVGGLVRGAYALVLLESQGTPDECERGLAELRRLGEGLGGPGVHALDPDAVRRLWELRHAASPVIARQAERGLVSTQFIEDGVVPPLALATYLEELEGILEDNGFDAVVFGHAGDGNVHVNPLIDMDSDDWPVRVRSTLDAVTELVARLGGTLAGEHGDGRLRAPLLERIWAPRLVEGFRMVKEALDSRGILNPGVVLPLTAQDPLAGFVPRPRSWPT